MVGFWELINSFHIDSPFKKNFSISGLCWGSSFCSLFKILTFLKAYLLLFLFSSLLDMFEHFIISIISFFSQKMATLFPKRLFQSVNNNKKKFKVLFKMFLNRCYLHINILYIFRGAICVFLSWLSSKAADYLVPISCVTLSNPLNFLSLIFLICKMRAVLEPTSSSTCEKQMSYMRKMLRTGFGTQ